MPFQYSPYAVPATFLGFNWVYAYAILSSRFIKRSYGIDHNNSPRQDLAQRADTFVREGKVTKQQVEMLQRWEAAHANSVEGYGFFIGAVAFALNAKVPVSVVNKACAVYTAARLIYGPLYILVVDENVSLLRSLIWWTGNGSCLYLLWQAATNVLV